jgi:hypothetical protein
MTAPITDDAIPRAANLHRVTPGPQGSLPKASCDEHLCGHDITRLRIYTEKSLQITQPLSRVVVHTS